MDCFNHICPFRVNETSNPNRCECTACPNKCTGDVLITDNRTQTTEYDGLIERLKRETYWLGSGQPYSHDVHPVICDEAASAITDLLARAEAAETRAEKAERCINDIEDDLDRGNDNDWAREHIAEYRSQKEE